jgi:hypothetical protein
VSGNSGATESYGGHYECGRISVFFGDRTGGERTDADEQIEERIKDAYYGAS